MRNLLDYLAFRVRRWKIQLSSTILHNIPIFKSFTKGVVVPGFNCYSCPLATGACPIGTIQHFITVRETPLYAVGVLGAIGAAVGRMPCGFICPFGFLQDLLYKIRTPKIEVSNRFGWFKYVVLVVLVLIVPYITLEPWFCKLCPIGALEAGIPWVLIDSGIRSAVRYFFFIKLAILFAFLFAMVTIKRPFCRFFCPLGAIYSLFNRVSFLKMEVDESLCSYCDLCKDVCPMDLAIYESPNTEQCIRCFECVKACPTGAISVSIRKNVTIPILKRSEV